VKNFVVSTFSTIKSPNSQFLHNKDRKCHFKLKIFQLTRKLHSMETKQKLFRISFIDCLKFLWVYLFRVLDFGARWVSHSEFWMKCRLWPFMWDDVVEVDWVVVMFIIFKSKLILLKQRLVNDNVSNRQHKSVDQNVVVSLKEGTRVSHTCDHWFIRCCFTSSFQVIKPND